MGRQFRRGRLLERAAPIATRTPGAIPASYALGARSVAVRQRTGTVAVTAVGMFADGAGFGITPLTVMSLAVVIGAMSPPREPSMHKSRSVTFWISRW